MGNVDNVYRDEILEHSGRDVRQASGDCVFVLGLFEVRGENLIQ